MWRYGCSRPRDSEPQRTFRRYEWSEPGPLLDMDAKRLQRSEAPGHWARRDRSQQQRHAASAARAL